MSTAKFTAADKGPTPITLWDTALGSHLLSILRAPDGTITISISTIGKTHYDLADEDWYSLKDKGFDVWTRTFGDEGDLSQYARDRLN